MRLERKYLWLVIIPVLIAIFALSYMPKNTDKSITSTEYPTVIVSGKVTTLGVGTTPTFVDFKSDTGAPNSANVDSGTYSITLDNKHSYAIIIHYSSLNITSGNCAAGTLSLNEKSSTLQRNISC